MMTTTLVEFTTRSSTPVTGYSYGTRNEVIEHISGNKWITLYSTEEMIDDDTVILVNTDDISFTAFNNSKTILCERKV